VKNTIKRHLINLKYSKNRLIRHIKHNEISYNMMSFTDNQHHIFFGYYDVTPFHSDEDILLAMKVPYKRKINVRTTEISLGYYNLSENSFHEFSKSSSWCWQQGCRMQWYANATPFSVLFNSFTKGEYVSYIVDCYSKKTLTKFSYPMYAVSPKGKWGLSLDFSRLQRLRPGYGYSNLEDSTKNQKCPDKSGIWKINLLNGESDLLFSINDIDSICKERLTKDAHQYFNHILFHPDGYSFLFFHIYQSENGRYIRLYKSDIEFNNITLLVDYDLNVSHFNWFSKNELMVTLGAGPKGRGYYLLHLEKLTLKKISGMYHDLDGHPSVSVEKGIIITDTVVDKYSERSLLQYNMNNQKTTLMKNFYSPPKYFGEIRCDLHPRVDFDKKKICIDSSHNGKRGMYIVNY
jgi:hypothetical protein